MQSQYYYFVTGLPALSFDDGKSGLTPEQFIADAKIHLTPGDFQLLMMLCLPEDIGDLLHIIYNEDREARPIAECSRWFWQTYAEAIKQKAADPAIPIPKDYRKYPDFLHQICQDIYSAEEMPPFLESQHKMLEATYTYCSNLGNKFVSDWFTYNAEIQNILTAVNGRKHKIPYTQYLIGHSELAEKLGKSHAADFGLGKDNEVFESVIRLWEQNDILDRERGYDNLRWKWIDDYNFFNYFNINRILGYYAQLRILNRWLTLDPSLGKVIFLQTMDNLSNSFSFPEQFNVKAISKK